MAGNNGSGNKRGMEGSHNQVLYREGLFYAHSTAVLSWHQLALEEVFIGGGSECVYTWLPAHIHGCLPLPWGGAEEGVCVQGSQRTGQAHMLLRGAQRRWLVHEEGEGKGQPRTWQGL
jgi:hypothetical protein